jgi:hypothetical protein
VTPQALLHGARQDTRPPVSNAQRAALSPALAGLANEVTNCGCPTSYL